MCFYIPKCYTAEKNTLFFFLQSNYFHLVKKNTTNFKHSALQIFYQTINASKKFLLKIPFTRQPNVSRELSIQKKNKLTASLIKI